MSAKSTESKERKTILVTGCSSGIGKATMDRFIQAKWNVVAGVRVLPSSTCATLVVKMDLSDEATLSAAVTNVLSRFGAIDALVNVAGVGLFGAFEEMGKDAIRDQFEVNFFGNLALIRFVLPKMRLRRAGVIANVSSIAGIYGFPALSAYSASKFALEGFSEALWYELEPLGVRVKLIEPGCVASTSFSDNSAKVSIREKAIPDYASIVDAARRAYRRIGLNECSASASDVAHTIFEAVTDGSDRLRYVAKTADVRVVLEGQSQQSESDRLAFMRERYLKA